MKVNNTSVNYKKGINIDQLLTNLKGDKRFDRNFDFKFLLMINNEIIDKEKYSSTILDTEDEIKIIPMMIGG